MFLRRCSTIAKGSAMEMHFAADRVLIYCGMGEPALSVAVFTGVPRPHNESSALYYRGLMGIL